MKRIILYNSLIFVLFFAFVLPSCKKRSVVYRLSGTVREVETNVILNAAKVELRTYQLEQLNFVTTQVASTQSTGNYLHEIQRSSSFSDIQLICSASTYFSDTTLVQNLDLYATKDPPSIDFDLEPEGWVRVKLVNSDGGSNDEILFRKQEGKTGCVGCCSNSNVTHTGSNGTSVICRTTAKKYFTVLYQSNNDPLATQSVLVNHSDTVEIVLEY